MKKLSSFEVRKMWLDFFQSKNHLVIESKSLVPVDDNSLLFINSGVATIKKYFSGIEVPASKRLTNSQKAIRTGDIENIGKTSRHHTMFEMLGNFSIGDYFKEEAIEFAFELLTSKKWFNFDLSKLYITFFEGDKNNEKDLITKNKWISLGVDKDHIFEMPAKNNFWDLGAGPCGPCTEIFYDRGEKYSNKSAFELIKLDEENDRFIEIWNIVFSQFNNNGNGSYTPLPQKNIDTGAGLERIVSIFQNTPTNFETDLFLPLINEIEKETKIKYVVDYIPSKLAKNIEFSQEAFKAIADFSRTIIFAIADGVVPSNTGRGYVIRRLLRKALIYARRLDINKPFVYKIAPLLSKLNKSIYLNLTTNLQIIIEKIKYEEDLFFNTLSKSIKLFEEEINSKTNVSQIDAKLAFYFYETYGLPYEVIVEILEMRNISIDKNEFDKLNEIFVNKSKMAHKNTQGFDKQEIIFDDLEPTNFIGYENLESTSKVIGIIEKSSNQFLVVLDKTPFYATSGGQEHDFGTINGIKINSVIKTKNNVFVHELNEINFKINDLVDCKIDKFRRFNLQKNHSAVHLMFASLEKLTKQSIPQVGSKVESDFFRFDFSYHKKIELQDLKHIEAEVNNWINKKINIDTLKLSQEDARKQGATFLDGAKYDPIVRVVKIGDVALDLCGGTHCKNTSEIEKIEILSFESKGSGIYRITGTSNLENIAKKRMEINSIFLKIKLQEISSKFNSLMNSLNDFNLTIFSNELNKIFNNLENISLDENIFDFKEKIDLELTNIKKYFVFLESEISSFLETKLVKEKNYFNFEINSSTIIENILKKLKTMETIFVWTKSTLIIGTTNFKIIDEYLSNNNITNVIKTNRENRFIYQVVKKRVGDELFDKLR